MKQFSCAYLTALQQKGDKEAEQELIKRWGRIPESQAQSQNCKCCGKIDVMATIKSLSTE